MPNPSTELSRPRKLFNLYVSYMRFALYAMGVAGVCFYVYSLIRVIGAERILEALKAAKLDAWFPLVALLLYVIYQFREQLGRAKRGG